MMEQDEFYEPEMTGTSIMAIACTDGVVLGADSRTTRGVYVMSRISDKIEPIHHRIFCLRSGASAHTQALSRYVRHYLQQQAIEENKLPLVSTAAKLFASMSYANKNFLQAAIIVAGWDPVFGNQVFEVPLGGTMLSQPFAIGGSGSSYIYGFCDSNWHDAMTVAEGKEFVTRALSHAMARDNSSGGIIRLTTVTEADVERTYVSRNELPFKL